jgi:hypothetical protein
MSQDILDLTNKLVVKYKVYDTPLKIVAELVDIFGYNYLYNQSIHKEVIDYLVNLIPKKI